ncbi:hypothetical protein EG328_010955 [Venturia inaequalis]|uniref:J domain-containing protein n=2 Tax=Venturia inaequalis TaxID=5025 RepID=A0A8H3U4U0_VENIN|nr:hypothetical protein EG328_010955 [Venturia inaequalis]
MSGAGFGNKMANQPTHDENDETYRFGATGGAGFGNKSNPDPDVHDDKQLRFGSHESTAPYSGGHPDYGSGSTGGAGIGNKTGNMETGDSAVGKMMEKVGGMVKHEGLVEKGHAKRVEAGLAAPFYNHYNALGIEQEATKTEIKRAWKNAVLRYHPDKNPTDPKKHAARFQAVQEAWEVLNDPYKKSNYDALYSPLRSHPGRAYATAKGPSQKYSQRAPPRAPKPAASQPSKNTYHSAPSPGPKNTTNTGSHQQTGTPSCSSDFASFLFETSGNGYEFKFYSSFKKPAEDASWKQSPSVPPFDFRSDPWGARESDSSKQQPSKNKIHGFKPGPEPFGFPGIPFRFCEGVFEPPTLKKPDLPKPKSLRKPPRQCTMMECSVNTVDLQNHVTAKKTFNMTPFGTYECIMYSPYGPGNSSQQSYHIPMDLKELG